MGISVFLILSFMVIMIIVKLNIVNIFRLFVGKLVILFHLKKVPLQCLDLKMEQQE